MYVCLWEAGRAGLDGPYICTRNCVGSDLLAKEIHYLGIEYEIITFTN